MCLNKLKFRMKNMKSIAWQAGCLLWLGMAVCNCTPASSGEDYASYVNPVSYTHLTLPTILRV